MPKAVRRTRSPKTRSSSSSIALSIQSAARRGRTRPTTPSRPWISRRARRRSVICCHRFFPNRRTERETRHMLAATHHLNTVSEDSGRIEVPGNGTITEQLARFVTTCDIDSMPTEVVDRARMFVLDYLGVTLTGSFIRSSRIIGDVVETMGGKEKCTVIGREYRSSPMMAALVNGTTGHAIEMDDDHRTSVLHPAVAVVPAAIAVAEWSGASGAKLLEGVVAGYEVMTRIGDAFLGTQYYEGFHPTGSCGVFGAAAAAARILDLPQDAVVRALGIAGTQAAGLEEWKTDGSWIKRL